MDDFDVTGMEPAAARDYLAAVLSTLKQTASKRISLEKEHALWTNRAKLAQENGKPDLVEAAEAKVAQVAADLEHIQGEETTLREGVQRIKSQLTFLQSQPQLSVDAEALLAQLELIGGERDELAEKFRVEEAESALQKLKESMNEDEEQKNGQ